jgi:NAD-dependent deacetylase
LEPLDLRTYQRIVILTGAGLSAGSGLPTYRGPGGLWERDEGLASLATAEALERDPAGVWRMFASLRADIRAVEPNAGHQALAELQRRYRGRKQIQVFTQNVDGLHQRAGSDEVFELHGSLLRSRCTDPSCGLPPSDDRRDDPDPPPCPRCGAALRPDVTLFGEMLPFQAEHAAKRALRDVDLFLAIGTSGTVSPASNFVRSAEYVGAHTVLINLEPMDPPNPSFKEQHLGRAEELLPVLLSG